MFPGLITLFPIKVAGQFHEEHFDKILSDLYKTKRLEIM